MIYQFKENTNYYWLIMIYQLKVNTINRKGSTKTIPKTIHFVFLPVGPGQPLDSAQPLVLQNRRVSPERSVHRCDLDTRVDGHLNGG